MLFRVRSSLRGRQGLGRDSLVELKAALRQLLQRLPADSRVRYADHIEGSGVALFERVCRLDLEGIIAKYKFGPYGGEDSLGTWYKIRNRDYSQMIGREKLFERDRHKEPVPGWHAGELASADAES
jgi:ATP-dependent DNA ligase